MCTQLGNFSPPAYPRRAFFGLLQKSYAAGLDAKRISRSSILFQPRPVPTSAGFFYALQGHALGFEER
jgi:hypothetical protein